MVSSSDVVAGDGEDVVTPVMVDESSNEEAAVVVISVRKVLVDVRGVPVEVGDISVRKVLVDARGVPVEALSPRLETPISVPPFNPHWPAWKGVRHENQHAKYK